MDKVTKQYITKHSEKDLEDVTLKIYLKYLK